MPAARFRCARRSARADRVRGALTFAGSILLAATAPLLAQSQPSPAPTHSTAPPQSAAPAPSGPDFLTRPFGAIRPLPSGIRLSGSPVQGALLRGTAPRGVTALDLDCSGTDGNGDVKLASTALYLGGDARMVSAILG